MFHLLHPLVNRPQCVEFLRVPPASKDSTFRVLNESIKNKHKQNIYSLIAFSNNAGDIKAIDCLIDRQNYACIILLIGNETVDVTCSRINQVINFTPYIVL